MRIGTRRKWWFWGMRGALSFGRLRVCGPRRLPLRPRRGGLRACPWGRGLGAGGLGGPALTWRPGGPIPSGALGEGGAGLRSPSSVLGWAWVLQCVRVCGLVSAGEKKFAWAAFGVRGGWAWGSRGVCGGRAGHWAGWVCREAWGSLRWVCAGCRVWGLVRIVRQEDPWRACVVVWAGGGVPCRGARGCAR